MKRFFSVLLLAACFAVTSASAQVGGEEFSAAEGYATAFEEASALLENPQLTMIGIQNIGDDEGGFSFSYNATNGKATGWIYFFQDANYPDITAPIIVFKYLMFFGSPVQGEEMEFPLPKDSVFAASGWMNSTEANAEFLKCEPYATLVAQNPTPVGLQIGMFYNGFVPELPPYKPFWAVQYEDSVQSITSAVQLVTKETFCNKVLTSVFESVKNIKIIDITQNNNIIHVSSSKEMLDLELSVFSLDGIEIFNQKVNSQSNNAEINVPLDTYASGSYVVIARSRAGIGTKTIVIAK